MKANEYLVLLDRVELGITTGWNRAHKHTDSPEPSAIQQAIEDAVMASICEYFIFDGVNDGDL